MKKHNYFETTDLLTCSVLVYFGHSIKEIKKTDPRRCVFVIDKKESTEKILDKFYRNKLRVEPKGFFEIQKSLKGRIYN